MSNPKWEIGPVKLMDGSEGHIDFVQPESKHYRYIGRAKNGSGEWRSWQWSECGRVPYTTTGYAKNLAPPPKKTVRVDAMWVVVYRDKVVSVTALEELAKSEAYARRALAIKKIEPFEVAEGEGL